MSAFNRVCKATKVVEEPDQVENGRQSERVVTKLNQNNIVGDGSLASNNPTEEQNLDTLNRGPI